MFAFFSVEHKRTVNFGTQRRPFHEGKHRLIRSKLNREEYKNNQTLQNQPFRSYFNAVPSPVIKTHTEKAAFQPVIRINVPEIGIEKWESPIPWKTLIRRPRTKRCEPLTESDEYFQYLASFPDLKPICFDDDPSKNLVFYLQKYPLLLKNVDDHQSATIVINKRRVHSPQLILQRHREAMDLKQKALERRIRQLEKESGEYFVTALRHKVFDPQSWPWNRDMPRLTNM